MWRTLEEKILPVLPEKNFLKINTSEIKTFEKESIKENKKILLELEEGEILSDFENSQTGMLLKIFKFYEIFKIKRS